MQRDADATGLISIAEAARQIGVNKSTLARQIKAGAIRSYEGKVRLSEVLEDRIANIDLTRAQRREGKIDVLGAAAGEALHRNVDATFDATLTADATIDDDATVLVDGEALPYAEARALKETYAARLKHLEFEEKRGTLVSIEDVAEVVAQEYATVRERLLTIPGKLASKLVGKDRAAIEAAIQGEIAEALEELSAPDDVAAAALRRNDRP